MDACERRDGVVSEYIHSLCTERKYKALSIARLLLEETSASVSGESTFRGSSRECAARGIFVTAKMSRYLALLSQTRLYHKFA